MSRTDREIAEYMAYYNNTTDRRAALEALARVEKKSEAEIRAICEKQGMKLNRKRGKTAALPEEKREEIKAALREGLSLSQAAQRCGVSSSSVGRIRLELVSNGENLPNNVGGRKTTEKYKKKHVQENIEVNNKHPEAYPGQIDDDKPEPIVEEDVKVFIPGEQSGTFDAAANSSEDLEKAVYENWEKIRGKAQKSFDEYVDRTKNRVAALRKGIEEQEQRSKYLTPPPVPSQPSPFPGHCGETHFKRQSRGLWFAIRDQLADFLTNTFGAGTELISERVETEYERVVVGIRTADGKKVRCTLRTEEDNE